MFPMRDHHLGNLSGIILFWGSYGYNKSHSSLLYIYNHESICPHKKCSTNILNQHTHTHIYIHTIYKCIYTHRYVYNIRIQMLYAVFIVLCMIIYIYIHRYILINKIYAQNARTWRYIQIKPWFAHLLYCYRGLEHLDSPGGQPSHAQLQAAS